MVLKVLADTSFLLLQAKFKIDLLAETNKLLGVRNEIVVIPQVVSELDRLAKEASERGVQAKLARELLSQIRTVEAKSNSRETVDEALTRIVREKRWIAGTADFKLKRRLRKLGVPVIFPREKSKLDIEGLEPAYC